MTSLHTPDTWESTRVTLRDLANTAYLEWRDVNTLLIDKLTIKQLSKTRSVAGTHYDMYSYIQTSNWSGKLKQLAAECDRLLQERQRTAAEYGAWCDTNPDTAGQD